LKIRKLALTMRKIKQKKIKTVILDKFCRLAEPVATGVQNLERLENMKDGVQSYTSTAVKPEEDQSSAHNSGPQ